MGVGVREFETMFRCCLIFIAGLFYVFFMFYMFYIVEFVMFFHNVLSL